MFRARTLAATAVGCTVLALTACGGDDDEASSSSSSSSPASSSSSAPATSSSSSAPSASGEATPPGTGLAVGESALLLLEKSSSAIGLVEVTVDGVREGTQAELDSLELGEDAEGLLPWYVDVTYTKVGDDADLGSSVLDTELDVFTTEGAPAASVIAFSAFEPCNDQSAPTEFTDGTTYSSCLLVAVRAGSTVGSVEFAPFDTDYSDAPVVWTA